MFSKVNIFFATLFLSGCCLTPGTPQGQAFDACLYALEARDCGQEDLGVLNEEICNYWVDTDYGCLMEYTEYQRCIGPVYDTQPACEPGSVRPYPQGLDTDPGLCGNEFTALQDCTVAMTEM